MRRFCLFVCDFFSQSVSIVCWTIQDLFGERKIYSSANGEKLQIVFLPNIPIFSTLITRVVIDADEWKIRMLASAFFL